MGRKLKGREGERKGRRNDKKEKWKRKGETEE